MELMFLFFDMSIENMVKRLFQGILKKQLIASGLLIGKAFNQTEALSISSSMRS